MAEATADSYITDAVTGAQLGSNDCICAIHKYAARCQGGSVEKDTPSLFEYGSVAESSSLIACSIHLPKSSPLRVFIGPARPTQPQARMAACFGAVQELLRMQLFSSTDFSTPFNTRVSAVAAKEPAMAFGQKAGQARSYPRYRAGFWKRTLDLPATRLYPTIISLHESPTGIIISRPLCILARSPLPSIAPFTASIEGQKRVIRSRRCAEYEVIKTGQLHDMQKFTTHLYEVVRKRNMNMDDPARCVCLVVPLIESWAAEKSLVEEDEKWPHPHIRQLVSWNEVADASPIDWKAPVFSAIGANGKFFPTSSMVHHTALAIPAVLARIDDLVAATTLNVRIFSSAIDTTLLANALTTPEAQRGSSYERLELLGDTILKHLVGTYVFIFCPPSDANKSLAMTHARRHVVSNAALVDLMRTSEVTAFLRSEALDEVAWMPPGYQRARGKKRKAASLQENAVSGPSSNKRTKKTIPGDDGVVAKGAGEVDFWGSFQHIASGKTDVALNDAKHKSIDGPEGAQPLGSRQVPSRRGSAAQRFLTDKVLSDVCEAIIGAAYLSGGPEQAFKCMKTIRFPLDQLDRWTDLAQHVPHINVIPHPPNNILPKKASLTAIQNIIGFELTQPHLLIWAVTHGSFTNEQHTPHEWLEFLGDGLLDYYIVAQGGGHDYSRTLSGPLKAIPPSFLERDGLYGGLSGDGLIAGYTRDLVAARLAEDRATANGQRPRGQYWFGLNPPKARCPGCTLNNELADVVEAILGAIYVSEGFDSGPARRMYDKVMKPFFDAHIRPEDIRLPATAILTDMYKCQYTRVVRTALGGHPPAYRCEIIVHDIVLAGANSDSEDSAHNFAVELASEALLADPNFIPNTCKCLAEYEARQAEKRRRTDAYRRKELEEKEKAMAGEVDDDGLDSEGDW
ncbi:hypothetical protein FRB96_006815 [Tulasnella sp. 330]|nr:hypothetical protein FRB96_006815 [Tulasnella sp. 330]KAG8878956.1 hypothetical protein FRB97_002052 [Tulasnella sp. 331]